MHADIDERAERGDVGHHAFQHHTRHEVADVFDAVGEARSLEFRARVAAGFFQFLDDVAHSRQAEAFIGELFEFQVAQGCGIADQLCNRAAASLDDALDHRIRLGMHG